MWEKIANYLIKRAMKTPYFHLEGYMNRYWLIPYGWWIAAARIHEILRSDDDRAFHDHPWPYLTIILRGGYYEVKPFYDKNGIYIRDTRVWYGPGSVLYRKATSYHRLEVPTGTTAWTLFITGRYKQTWGFLPNPDVKVPYRKYLNLAPTQNSEDSFSVHNARQN